VQARYSPPDGTIIGTITIITTPKFAC